MDPESVRFGFRLSQIQIWTPAIIKSPLSNERRTLAIYLLPVSKPVMHSNPDWMLLFSSWYLKLDTGDLLVAGVQIWIWEKYLNLNLKLIVLTRKRVFRVPRASALWHIVRYNMTVTVCFYSSVFHLIRITHTGGRVMDLSSTQNH